jgi:ATP-dependent exoDNAse (exonuclease V) alpha subunit
MPLNLGQKNASTECLQFLLSPDKEFRIAGPAGVGKTFMLKYIMNTLIKQYEQTCKLLGIKPTEFDIALTATTNKAAEVLATSTGYPTQTIHSFMNLRVYDDYSSGVSKCNKTRSWHVHRETIIFIDEASMVDENLYKFLMEGTDKTCKIIYIGDRHQLAPVFEKVSKVYATDHNLVELTEPVRNADQPALMNLCEQFRDTVKTGVFKPIVEVPGVIDFIDDTKLAQMLDVTLKPEDVDARILMFTNQRVHDYNEYLREVRGHGKMFAKGEILVNNASVEISDKIQLSVEQQFLVLQADTDVREIVVCRNDSSIVMDIYKMRITHATNPNGEGFDVRIPYDMEHYKKLMNYFSNNKMWPDFYNLKNNFPDLRMKDASTVYKAQGSTYEFVILDLTNIGLCKDAEQTARMLYVGVSRPTTRIFLYGKLPPKYAG